MITRMEMIYRSEEICDKRPKIFSTGGYEITLDGKVLNFDFLNMEADCRFEHGYLFMDVFQQNIDDCVIGDVPLDVADEMLRNARKEDFTEIYYECFADGEQEEPIKLIPVEIKFFDFSDSGSGEPIVVGGLAFNQL